MMIQENRRSLRVWYIESRHKDGNVIIRDDIWAEPRKARRSAETYKRNVYWAMGMLQENQPFGYKVELLHHIVRWTDYIKEVEKLDE